MPSVGELQRLVRRAIVHGDDAPLAGLLVGGRDGRARLAIHRRHYDTSLIRALLDRFPATAWLIGSDALTGAARQFVRDHPPARPCLAEYGDDLPGYLAAWPDLVELPYLRSFAELEWHLGRLSLSVTRPALDRAALAALVPDEIVDLTVTLQPDVHYFSAAYAVDDLMRLYLTDSAPDRFLLADGNVWLELRAARSELRISRIDRASCAFRAALKEGRTLGEASMSAVDLDPAFDPGHALASLIADGLVTEAHCA